MKKHLFAKVLIAAFAVVSLTLSPAAFASEPRDNDSNAIIFGGAYSKGELIRKVTEGTGKPNQSGKELTNLFNTLGMDVKFFDVSNFKDGQVFKNGNVVVDGKTVKSNVFSMGRHNMSGSERDNRFPYPVYWRHPSVSFVSNSIPAFVYMNDDGTMAFAVIKSCGNPVKGVGVKPKPAPVEAKHSLEIKKFNDMNANKLKDSNEELLSGWSFKVTGPNFSKTVVTGANGSVVISDLKEGQYQVEEIQQEGWSSTTGLTKTVQLTENQIVVFGNKKNEVSAVEQPVEKTVVIKETPAQPLPTSGPTEAAAGTIGLIGLGGITNHYRKAKKALESALKKF